LVFEPLKQELVNEVAEGSIAGLAGVGVEEE
jgi:hypothetical protein